MDGQTKNLQWSSRGILAILQEDGALYLYDPNARTLAGRANDVRNFVWSEDGTMLATLEHRSIEIFSLTDGTQYWRLNLPEVERIAALTWYADKQHLFLHYPDRIAFVGLDDRSLENIKTVAETPHGVYRANENRLYFIGTDDLLRRLDFPG